MERTFEATIEKRDKWYIGTPSWFDRLTTNGITYLAM